MCRLCSLILKNAFRQTLNTYNTTQRDSIFDALEADDEVIFSIPDHVSDKASVSGDVRVSWRCIRGRCRDHLRKSLIRGNHSNTATHDPSHLETRSGASQH